MKQRESLEHGGTPVVRENTEPGLAEQRITRARAIKLAGAMGTAGAFALFLPDEADAANKKRRRRRRRRRARQRRQNNITSSESNSFVSPGVNIPVTEDVIVTNNGTEPVTVRPEIIGDGFTLVDANGVPLAPGTTITLQPGNNTIPVTFAPSVDGTTTGELRLVDAADGLLLETVNLTGTVTAPVTP